MSHRHTHIERGIGDLTRFVWLLNIAFSLASVCSYRVARSFCQSGGGRLRTMPLYRYCEKYAGPKVESTLWSVSQQAHRGALWHVGVCPLCLIKKQIQNVCVCMRSCTTWNLRHYRKHCCHRNAAHWFYSLVCLCVELLWQVFQECRLSLFTVCRNTHL